jgi:putative glutamine amidotransferase
LTPPLTANPARFFAPAFAPRCAAEAHARALIEAARRADGEPAIIHPANPATTDVATRLARFDGAMLPGGDGGPHRHRATDSVCDVDDLQDAFGLEAARKAAATGLPLPTIRRGRQAVDVVLDETLAQAPCHHQWVDRPGQGLDATARIADGAAEGLELPGARVRLTAVQGHPEDAAQEDTAQRAPFDALVRATRDRG